MRGTRSVGRRGGGCGDGLVGDGAVAAFAGGLGRLRLRFRSESLFARHLVRPGSWENIAGFSCVKFERGEYLSVGFLCSPRPVARNQWQFWDKSSPISSSFYVNGVFSFV